MKIIFKLFYINKESEGTGRFLLLFLLSIVIILEQSGGGEL